MEGSFEGKIYWDGTNPKIQGKDKFVEWLKQFPEDQWFTFTANPTGSINNTNQQKLYHKWCDVLATEFGWDSSTEMHDFLKTRYSNGKSTKSFDTKQWSEYMTKVLSFAGEHNILLPIGSVEE